ncbi:MAG: FAD-dependent oxidoreductase, partial [Planctomycetales bacterium]|nr:FAD-dependent oxidoreductase [Planctomycetales bacterium]
MHYDIIVVGSGPAGQKAAIAAAKQLDRVAIVDRRPTTLGGVCLHSGTIPSKTMREAILHLTGYRQRDIYRSRYRNKRHIRMKDLRRKLNEVTNHELNVIHDQLDRNGVHVYTGNATFRGPHSIFVHATDHQHVLSADKIILACGTVPSRPDNVPFDNLRILDSDQILRIDHIPQSLIVVGGGVIGIEYAIMFAALGVRVTVVDGRPRLLEFCDQEIVDVLLFHAREMGMTFRLGENVTGFHKTAQNLVAVETESGKRLVAESVMYSAGRVGDTAGLNLELAGLHPDTRGRLKCDENHRTEAPHIYAV